MEKDQLIATFLFERSENGNLTGIYSDAQTFKTKSENALALEKMDLGSFEGVYNSSWIEDDEAIFSTLEITQLLDDLYELKWKKDGKQTSAFEGQGYINDSGKLVGYIKSYKAQFEKLVV